MLHAPLATLDRTDAARDSMIFVPGGTFRMGSDRHYPEEAPVHRVTVDGFWMDRTPVTNRQFREFVRATGHVTVAELAPDREGLSRRSAASDLRRLAGVRAARSTRSVCADFSAVVDVRRKGRTGVIRMARRATSTVSTTIPSCTWPLQRCAGLRALGSARTCRRKRNGNSRLAADWTAPSSRWGDEFAPDGRHLANIWQGEFPLQNLADRRIRADVTRDGVSAEWLRPLRHDRQRLGMDRRLVFAPA